MRISRSFSLALLTLVALVHPSIAQTSPSEAVTRRVMVKLRGEASDAQFAEIAKACGARQSKRLVAQRQRKKPSALDRWRTVEVSSSGKRDAAIRCLEAQAVVEVVAPDSPSKTFAIPNDPEFRRQWHLRNIGQWSGYQDADVDATEAWDVPLANDPVVVAVVDEGVDHAHLDLAANMWENDDPPGDADLDTDPDDDGNGYVDDLHGYDFVGDDGDPAPGVGEIHGTAVAGVIAAVGNNATGISGVTWNARIMSVRVGSVSETVQGVVYAVDNGARIVNASWGCFDGTPIYDGYDCGSGQVALYEAAMDHARDNGVLVVAAAGNVGLGRFATRDAAAFPAAFTHANIISVAATGEHDELADFSVYDDVSVDLGAPGVEIWTTLPDDAYAPLAGTSFAAPMVAGAAALLLEDDPMMTVAAVKSAILGNVDALDSLAGKTVTGGRLNLARTLAGTPTSISSGHAPYDGNHASLTFDGVNDRLDLATLPTLFGSSSPSRFSMSVWVKMLETPGNYGGVVAATSNLLATDGLGFTWIPGPRMAFYVDGLSNRVQTEPNELKPGVWNHLVATYDGTLGDDHLKLYVNGELVDEVSAAGPLSLPSVALEVGRLKAYTGSADQFNVNAAIDDLAIWNTPLTPAEVTAIYNRGGVTDLVRLGGAYASSEALLGYWRLGDETASGVTRDVTEENNAASVNMVSDPSSSDVPTRFASNQSVTFDGVDAYAAGPNADAVLGASTNELTVSLWVKGHATPSVWEGLLVATSNTLGTDGFGLHFASSTTVRGWIGGLAGHTSLTATLDPSKWNHVALTFDSSLGSGNVRLFVNGSLAGSQNRNTSLSVPTTPIRIGRFATASFFADASIDEVAIWSTALTDAEVAEVAVAGVPRDVERAGGSYVSHRTLAAAWRMGEQSAGTTIPDLVGSQDLTLVDAGGAPVNGDVPQRYDASTRSSDLDQRVALASLEDLLGPDVEAFSLSYWVKLDDGGCPLDGQRMVGTTSALGLDGFNVGWELGFFSSFIVTFTVSTDSGFRTTWEIADELGEWNHVVAVYNGSNVRLYLNGSSAGALSFTGSVTLPRRVIEVGRLATRSRTSVGWVDELAIFDRALDADEVASIYGGGGASNLLASFGDYTPSGLAGYWKLGERSDGLVIPDELGLHDGTLVEHGPTAIDGDVPSDPGAPTEPCS